MTRDLRPAPGTILRKDKHYKEVVERVKESLDAIVVHTMTEILIDGRIERRRGTIKRQKYLCVNGPSVGQRLAELEADEYVLYNRASGVMARPIKWRDIPRCVLVHRAAFT